MSDDQLAELNKLAVRVATGHRPRGFTACATRQALNVLVEVQYCWRDNPRYEVIAELTVIAEEIRRAALKLPGHRVAELDYPAEGQCHFYIYPAEGAS